MMRSSPTPDLVEWPGMLLPCRIGVLPGESDRPQLLRLFLRVYADLTPAMASGRIEDTLDYGRLSEEIRRVVDRGPWTLLESLAGELLRELTRDPRVARAAVRISKENPPLPEDVGPVAVEIERSREFFWS